MANKIDELRAEKEELKKELELLKLEKKEESEIKSLKKEIRDLKEGKEESPIPKTDLTDILKKIEEEMPYHIKHPDRMFPTHHIEEIYDFEKDMFSILPIMRLIHY